MSRDKFPLPVPMRLLPEVMEDPGVCQPQSVGKGRLVPQETQLLEASLA